MHHSKLICNFECACTHSEILGMNKHTAVSTVQHMQRNSVYFKRYSNYPFLDQTGVLEGFLPYLWFCLLNSMNNAFEFLRIVSCYVPNKVHFPCCLCRGHSLCIFHTSYNSLWQIFIAKRQIQELLGVCIFILLSMTAP